MTTLDRAINPGLPIETGESASELDWYLLWTKRHYERRAQLYLDSKGVATYLPLTLLWPKPAVGSEIAPLFPGYLFVKLSLRADYKRVCWAPGIKDFVRQGGDQPTVVPPGVLDFLRGRQSADGLIHCEDSVDGREMRIVRGPLKDLHGIVAARLTGRERVVLLMDLLRRQVRVQVPERWLTQN